MSCLGTASAVCLHFTPWRQQLVMTGLLGLAEWCQ